MAEVNTLDQDNAGGYTTKVAAGLAPMNGIDIPLLQDKHVYVESKKKRLSEVITDLDKGSTATDALDKRVTANETAIQTLTTTVNGKTSIDDTKAAADKTYSSQKIEDAISTAKSAVKSEILNGAPETLDTLKEVADAINTNKDAITALQQLAGAHVRYDQAQDLTTDQKAQARKNIDAAAVADLAAKLNGTIVKAPAAEDEKVALDELTTEGEYIVQSPSYRPANFNADPLLVSVRRQNNLLFQTVGGIDGSRYKLFARTGTYTPADGDTPEKYTWSTWTEVGAVQDLSGYALKTDLNAVSTVANDAKNAAATNASAITALQNKVTSVENQVGTNTGAIQTNATAITNLQNAMGTAKDFVATFETELAAA